MPECTDGEGKIAHVNNRPPATVKNEPAEHPRWSEQGLGSGAETSAPKHRVPRGSAVAAESERGKNSRSGDARGALLEATAEPGHD